jgi:hypothetical protein
VGVVFFLMVPEKFFRERKPDRRVMSPKVMGRMISAIQEGTPGKATFPIWTSFLMNFKAAKVSKAQMKEEKRSVMASI